ncbi:helix-turn-helix domain-containing protein [Streptomyces johnsoniae]|uniref:LuxR C-terminal-related transcriptional regulator n=1 Tax=Streptomyces johnsoniae TaxID=3075532 RepID=A0ABU2S849_9ACTN|nr:LuxR C-terminal-related transcriptional regulator [Streptomyces sp. DSM 41886]MDT0445157.1 LuxR C-terminal-related transcriptional regulator [Streptomyces sp. DSM 41886]
MREILEHGLNAGSAVLTVEGIPGIGKTRLLREAAAVADRLGYRFAQHRGPGPGPRTGRTHALLSGQLAGRPRQAEAAGRPLLVVLDTPDRPDHTPPPRRHRALGGRVVWLIARRPGCPRPLPADDQGRRGERLVLGPLAHADAVRLAQDTLGAPPGPALRRLLERAGGHPQLLVDLLAGLKEEGGLHRVAGEADLSGHRLPTRLTARVGAVLDRYSSGCRQLLCIAAILGDEVVYEDLAAMTATSVSALLPAIEEVRATGFVRTEGTRTVFLNPLLRQLIAASMPPTLRTALIREASALRAAAREPAAGRGPAAPPRPGRDTVPVHVPAPVPGPPAAQPDETDLNQRQQLLVDLVGEGLTNQQIARRLAVSHHTVNYHLRKLFKVFGVSSRIDLLNAAERQRTPAGARRP